MPPSKLCNGETETPAIRVCRTLNRSRMRSALAGLVGPLLMSRAPSAVTYLSAITSTPAPLSLEEVRAAASRINCELRVQATGPSYRIELLWRPGSDQVLPTVPVFGGEDAPPPELLGFSNGYTQPFGAAHLETIQVRKFTGYWARRRSRGGARYENAPRTSQGLGLLIGAAVICWIREYSPFKNNKAELLAIRDDARQHKTLVRYYRYLGFETLRDVDGGALSSMRDLVVWGGEGLLMELDCLTFLQRWANTIRAIGQPASALGSNTDTQRTA